MIYAHFFVANTISAGFLLQKSFEHTCFVAKTIYTHFFCHKNYLCTFLSQKEFMHTFFVAKTIYMLFCHENDLRTSSGKFLRVESCHPESSDFLGLWHPRTQSKEPIMFLVLNITIPCIFSTIFVYTISKYNQNPSSIDYPWVCRQGWRYDAYEIYQ